MSLLAIAAIATILSYHEVDPPQNAHSTIPRIGAANTEAEELRYTVTPENFAAQLDYLQDHGYHVIPLADLVEFLEGKRSELPPHPVVITVDDGWLCAYTQIAPAMRKRGMPFTLFVYPAIVGKGAHYLTWDQIEELSRDGVDIESHTYSHPFLTAARHPEMSKEAYAAFLQHELADSRAEIEAHTGKPVHFIAYPYSEYDAGVIEAAQGAGYVAGLYDREVGAFILPNTLAMRMKRFPIKHDTTLDEFKTYLP